MSPLSYSIESAAEATGLSKSHLDRAIRAGELKVRRTSEDAESGKVTGKRVILARELEAYLESLPEG